MVRCSFCGCETSPIHGVHLIKNDGTINFFCSSKCRKNAVKLKRDKRRLKWTASYREEKDKLAVRDKEMKHRAAVKETAAKEKEHTEHVHHASGAEHHEKKEQTVAHEKKKK